MRLSSEEQLSDIRTGTMARLGVVETLISDMKGSVEMLPKANGEAGDESDDEADDRPAKKARKSKPQKRTTTMAPPKNEMTVSRSTSGCITIACTVRGGTSCGSKLPYVPERW